MPSLLLMMRNNWNREEMYKSMQTFYIIGISDDRNQFLSPEIRNLVSQGKVFSGGKRHHELVHAYLPEDAVWTVSYTHLLAKWWLSQFLPYVRREAETPVGFVRQAGRKEETVTITTLQEFDPEQVDMFTVVLICLLYTSNVGGIIGGHYGDG